MVEERDVGHHRLLIWLGHTDVCRADERRRRREGRGRRMMGVKERGRRVRKKEEGGKRREGEEVGG